MRDSELCGSSESITKMAMNYHREFIKRTILGIKVKI